jgi:tubulin monoglycylase TTLL3/8
LEESDFQSNFVSADNVWILKPSNLSQGRGIRVFHSLKDLFEEVQKRAKEPFVVQKYLERPMLIFGRKFDIRQWVLISSANPDPLRVHWYPKCYIRFCSKKFKTDDLSDKFIHLCNNSIQRFNYLEQEGTFIEGLMWTSNEFQHYLVTSFTDPNIWSETILPQMKNAALQSIKAVKNRLIRVGVSAHVLIILVWMSQVQYYFAERL